MFSLGCAACNSVLDLAFVIDSSGSINDADAGNWALVQNFMKNVVEQFIIGPNAVLIGAVSFSNNGRLEFLLNKYKDKSALSAAVGSIEYIGGTTNTADGLQVSVHYQIYY